MIRLLLASLLVAIGLGNTGEILNNRDFENKEDNMKGWTVANGRSAIEDTAPVHPGTPNYLTIYSTAGTVLSNDCNGTFEVRQGEIFDFNAYVNPSQKGKMVVFIIDENGEVIGGNTFKVKNGGWKRCKCSIQVSRSSKNCKIDIVPPMGKVSIDAASLVSTDNYK